MTIHVTPIPKLIDLVAPAYTLGLTNTAGAATTAVASDSTLLAYDTTVPTTIAYGASAAAGDTATAARRNHTHGMAASDAVAQASEAEMEGETDVNKYVPPDLVRYSPGVAKVWGKCAAGGTLAAPSYNIYSTGKDSTGVYTWTWADDFSDVDYALLVTPYDATAFFNPDTIAVGSVKVRMFDTSSNYSDRGHSVAGFGEQ